MNILIIEDNIDHLELFIDMLHEAYQHRAHIKSFSLLEEGLSYLNSHNVDLFLCDLQLPDSSITETVQRLKSLQDTPAIIVLTSLNDDLLAQDLVQQGIQDYLPKDEINKSHLMRACNYAIERRKLTDSLQNKNEDYRAFCYSLTHDFKSSLWQIARFAQIFKTEAIKKYPDEQSLPFQFLDKIFEKVENIQQLVHDLQDYLSLDVAQANFSVTSLDMAIHNAIDMLGEKIERHKAEIIVDKLPEIMGNQSHLQLLFVNLIGNALKYNDKENPKIAISVNDSTAHYTQIEISDNGLGIPSNKLDTIFIPFERAHSVDSHPGSGLGLSIVKRITQYHNGRISVRSKVGVGTSFTLKFPKIRD